MVVSASNHYKNSLLKMADYWYALRDAEDEEYRDFLRGEYEFHKRNAAMELERIRSEQSLCATNQKIVGEAK